MKLPLKKTQTTSIPNWHPDFRNVAALPDLKVVRTTFVVNVVCTTVAVGVVLFTVFQEYRAFSVRSEISRYEEQIESSASQNSRLLAKNREFQAGADKFAEALRFVEAPLVASKLLVALGNSLPDNMEFTAVTYEGGSLALRGTIRGASDTASNRLTAYLDILRQDAVIGPLFPEISLTSLLRDPRTQGLSFEISLTSPAPPPAKS